MTDVFHKNYSPLSQAQKDIILAAKTKAEELHTLFNSIPASREVSLSQTKLEEAVMWFVKGAAKG